MFVDCWVCTNCVTLPPDFSYVEVDMVVVTESLDLMDGSLD